MPQASNAPAVELPEGNVFFVLEGIPENFGGLTRACLSRARAFVDQAGRPVTVLTLRAKANPGADRSLAEAQGLLEAPNRLLNLHEALLDWDHHAEPGERPNHPDGLVPEIHLRYPPAESGENRVRSWLEENLLAREPLRRVRRRLIPDVTSGAVWRVDWRTEEGALRVQDHRRPDGTLYLRRLVEQRNGKDATASLTLHDRQERTRDRFPTVPALAREWIGRITGDERAFFVVDGQAVGQQIRAVRNKDRFVHYVMHGTHIKPPIRIDGPIRPVRAHMLRDLAELDGLVLLTESQRRDVALRDGDRTNLFVIGNQSRPLPEYPDPTERTPRTALVVSRLVGGKRVGDTIRAFGQVVERLPDAHLVIYGDGAEAPELADLTAELGLDQSVTFKGFDPAAADAFRTATVSVLSSAWEGQPLTILESLGAGCPVVAYDITYGPADMITDGVEGRLVPDGDVDALATALHDVLADEEGARAMSRAAWERSFAFDQQHHVQRWADTFRAAMAQRAHRVTLRKTSWGRLSRAVEDGRHRVTATVGSTVTAPEVAREEYRLSWVLVDQETGAHEVRPARVSVSPRSTADRTRWDVSGEFATDPFGTGADLHLDLVWNNAHWRSGPLPDPGT